MLMRCVSSVDAGILVGVVTDSQRSKNDCCWWYDRNVQSIAVDMDSGL